MAHWVRATLTWTSVVPSTAALRDLTDALRERDYDFPELYADGWGGSSYRSPSLDAGDIEKFLTERGYPCKVAMEDVDDEWHYR